MIALLRKISIGLAVAKAVKKYTAKQLKDYRKRNTRRAKLKRLLFRR